MLELVGVVGPRFSSLAKSMSFFRKKKKAPAAVGTHEASHTPIEQPSPQQVRAEPPELTSSTDVEDASPTVVREPTSIFGGMVLSSSVRKREGQDSPYLSTGQDGTKAGGDGTSAFGFISDSVASDPPDKETLGETLGEGERGEEKSAFGFISPKPAADEPSQQSGFSFINSSDTDHVGEGGGKEETKHSPEGIDLSLRNEEIDSSSKTREALSNQPDLPVSGVTHSEKTPVYSRPTDSPQPVFRNSSGVLSPVPGPISPPLVSTPAGRGGGGGGGKASVGKQQPTAGKKRKKRKVVRPGQEVDTTNEGTNSSSLTRSSSGARLVGGEEGQKEPDTLSLTSQASSVDTSSSLPNSSLPITPSVIVNGSSVPGLNESAASDGGKEGTVEEVKVKREEAREGEDARDGNVSTEERSELLVDTSELESMEGGGGKGGGGEGEGESVVFQDEQLLAEVFAGGGSESGDQGEKGVEVGEMKTGEVKSGNYSVELSSSDQLALLIQSSESNLARIRLELADLHREKQSLLDRHISAAKQQRHNRQKMKELRARETKALSEEDYELAEELQGQLETVSRDSSWSISSTSHPLLCDWLKEVCDMVQTEETMQSDIRTKLAHSRDQQSQALASAEENITAYQTKQKMKLKALEDKIERERGHIALDKEHLHKREQQLQEEIASRAEKFISKKTSLQGELETVHSEIEELEKKLAELRGEEARLGAAIAGEEARIQAVHLELDSEDAGLQEERDGIARRELELLAQQEGMEEVRQEYEEAQQQQKAHRESIAGLLGRVEMKWEESERRTHTLAQCLGRAGDLTDMNTASLLSPSAQLTKCREAVGEKEGEVKKVASEIEALQGTVAQLRRQISAAEERIPRLEEAKKTAVTARRYKEAGRLSSELKQLKTELEPQKTQLAEKEGEVGDVNKRLAGLSSELAGERVHLDQLERQEDLQHLRRLTSSLSRLQATKTRWVVLHGQSPWRPVFWMMSL
ncbi:hypothetical protein GBAR_LOCUS14498 [Geodia barretti]|uniref:Uncharacterized protein n=1 Tax=Geodia barretti TaxID=519541 RepID=A0AA35SAD6_GEOBA|nr:hypothetical protein GBAR_LOCUS14498 [Geodia barretti]